MVFSLCLRVKSTEQIILCFRKSLPGIRVLSQVRLSLLIRFPSYYEMHIFPAVFLDITDQFIISVFVGQPLYHVRVKHICASAVPDGEHLLESIPMTVPVVPTGGAVASSICSSSTRQPTGYSWRNRSSTSLFSTWRTSLPCAVAGKIAEQDFSHGLVLLPDEPQP